MTWVSAGVAIGSTVLGGISGSKEKKRQKALQNQTAAVEADRDARTKLVRGQIDTVFDSPKRQAQHAQFGESLRGYLGSQLGRKQTDAVRNLKFALAKQGLTGGSVDVDSGRRLGEEFSDAAIGNERTVAGEVAQLRSQDEQQRNALKAMASSGMGLTEANRRASEAAQQGLATADYGARVKGIGDVFADTAATYKAINERAAMRSGYGHNARRADLYGRS